MEIVNIVASVEMEKPFILSDLLNKLPDAELLKHWVKIRIPPNNTYVAFYKKGKFSIIGVKSVEEIYSVADSVIDLLKKNNISNNINNIKINNCVLIDQINFDIDLDKLIIELSDYQAYYEPEIFHALKFKDDNEITYLLFGTGKITITGVKSLDNVEKYVNDFKELIYEKSHK